MGTKKFKFCFISLSILIGVGFAGWPVSAKALSGLSFTPAYLRIDVPVGTPIQDSAIAVKNNSAAAVRLHAAAADVDNTTNNLTPLSTAKTPATHSVQIRNPDLTLQPGQSVNILVRVDATKLPPGGQFTSVEVKQIADPSKKGLPINQVVSIGMFIVKEQGAIRTLQLKTDLPSGLITSVPTEVSLRFYADGNVNLVPRAAVTVTEGNEVIAKATINDLSATIQPQTNLEFKPVLAYQKPLSPGRHVLSVTYRYDGQQEPLVVESTFWYVPVWYVLAIIFGLASLGLLWWHHRRQPKPGHTADTRPIDTPIPLELTEEVTSETTPKTKHKAPKKAAQKKTSPKTRQQRKSKQKKIIKKSK